MKKIAVFPGSFDPITVGHVDLVRRAAPLFDKVIVAIGVNSQKKYLLSLEDRLDLLESVFKKDKNVEIGHYEKLTARYCQKVGAKFLIRGLRNASDFDYEKTISQMNSVLADGLESVFLIATPKYSHISSTLVREIVKGGGDVSPFVPKAIAKKLGKMKF